MQSLTEKFGARELAGITGLRAHQMYSISKMMWIKKTSLRFTMQLHTYS